MKSKRFSPSEEYGVAAKIFNAHMEGKSKNVNPTDATYKVAEGLDIKKIVRYLKEMFGRKE